MVACEPLVPAPTPQTIIITATPSPGPTATATFTVMPTPDATSTSTPTVTPTPPLCTETEGQVFDFADFSSAVAGRTLSYRVYVPPCYFESQRRYPLLMLLHGSSNDETHWQDLGVIDTLNRGLSTNSLPPMILVMPYGGSLHASADFSGGTLEDYLLDELLPQIEQDFCVWEDRDYRAIGGISRGGFWALSIAFRNPDVFGAVGGHSPALDTDITPPNYNPLDLVLNESFIDTLRIYLDYGAEDIVRLEVEQLGNRLVEQRIPHDYVIDPLGDHTDAYWSGQVDEYLKFYGGVLDELWPRDIGALPSCLEPSP